MSHPVPTTQSLTIKLAAAKRDVVDAVIEDFNKKIKRFNKRNVDMNLPNFTYVIGDVEKLPGKGTFFDLTVTGPAVQLPGWTIAAAVEGTKSGNLLRAFPVAEGMDLEAYRTGTGCEHCNTNRFRKNLYVVLNAATNEAKMVGSTCLNDYTGCTSAGTIVTFLDNLWRELGSAGMGDGEGGLFGGGEEWFTLEAYLTWVYAAVRTTAWVSGKDAYARDTESTAQMAWDAPAALDHWHKYGGRKPDIDPSADDKAAAKRALELLPGVIENARADNSFMGNLDVIVKEDIVTRKRRGVAAAIYPVVARELARLAKEDAANKIAGTSDHVGTIGKRQDFGPCLLLEKFDVNGEFGFLTIHKFLTQDGNALTWFASKDELTVGTTYELRATVKKHTEYKDQKETVVNRAATTAVDAG